MARGSSVDGLLVSGARLVVLSGLIAHDPDGHIPHGLEAQCRHIFEHMAALLGEAGGSLANVVKLTTFLTTLDGYDTFLRVRKEYFAATPPASSTVQVAALVRPEALIEVEALAVLD